MDLSRFKSYGLWVSIFALIPLVLQGFGVNVLPGNYEEIVVALLGVLVMAGILNNPTSGNKGYLDDKTKEEIPEETNDDKLEK